MSIVSSLVLKNAANGDVTFARESSTGTTVTLRDTTQPVWARAARAFIRNVLPSKAGKVVRHQKELEMPIFDASGVLLRTYRYKSEYLLPVDGTEAERDELLARAKTLESHATTAENVSDLNLSS